MKANKKYIIGAAALIIMGAFGAFLGEETEAPTTTVAEATTTTTEATTTTTEAPTTTTTEAAPEVSMDPYDVEFFSTYEDLAIDPHPTLEWCLSSQARANWCGDMAFTTWDLVITLETEARKNGLTCVQTAALLLTSTLVLTEGPDGMTHDDAVSFLAAGIVTWAPDGLLWDSIDCMDEAAVLVDDALTKGVDA